MRSLTLCAALVLVSACAPGGAPDESSDEYEQSLAIILRPSERYEDRLKVIELLQAAHPYPAGVADARDGIRLQTEWQLSSGRAAPDPSTGRIDSWWGDVNYTLSVWQLLALQQVRGEFSNVVVEGAPVVPSEVASKIVDLYDAIDLAREQPGAQGSAHETREHLQKLMWTFHVASVHAGLPKAEKNFAKLPSGEREFAESWGYTLVDLIAIINFPTNEAAVGTINAMLLPQRVVRPEDFELTEPTDLPYAQRLGIAGIDKVHQFEKWSGGLLSKGLMKFADAHDRVEMAQHLLIEALQVEDPVEYLWWALREHTPGHELGASYESNDSENGCGTVTYEGACEGNTVIWCESGLQSTDCSDVGGTCGFSDADGYYACLGTQQDEAACGDVTYHGLCEGEVLSWCEDGEIYVVDCAAAGAHCKLDSESGLHDCL